MCPAKAYYPEYLIIQASEHDRDLKDGLITQIQKVFKILRLGNVSFHSPEKSGHL